MKIGMNQLPVRSMFPQNEKKISLKLQTKFYLWSKSTSRDNLVPTNRLTKTWSRASFTRTSTVTEKTKNKKQTKTKTSKQTKNIYKKQTNINKEQKHLRKFKKTTKRSNIHKLTYVPSWCIVVPYQASNFASQNNWYLISKKYIHKTYF